MIVLVPVPAYAISYVYGTTLKGVKKQDSYKNAIFALLKDVETWSLEW